MEHLSEKRTEIYYKKAQSHEIELKRFQAWQCSERNRTLLNAFQEHLFASGTGQYRVAKVLMHLRRLCDLWGIELDQATKKDLTRIVATINQSPAWADETKRDYKRILKHFYRWYEDDDPRLTTGTIESREEARAFYKYLEKSVSTAKPRRSIGQEAIITDEDCQRLIRDGCNTPLERAVIAVLHNTGARVGELLNLRLQDYQRRGQHALLRLDGKTGERIVPILQAIPWLEQWIQCHPFRDNPRALLWVSTHYGKGNSPLRYRGIQKLLERVFLRANVRKQHNPHWFRHSRATIWSKDFSHAVLCRIMGWEHGSKQAKTYEHLTGADVESQFLKQNGLIPQEEQKATAQFCKCSATNAPDAKYCYKCGSPLTVSIVMQEQDYLRKAFELLMNPETQRQYEHFKNNPGEQK